VDVNLNIEKGDIDFLKQQLHGKELPLELGDIAYQVALFKTREKRTDKVKIYNPDCEYEVGDLIYKEYPGKIPIGAKKHIEREKGVVLKVSEIRERFGLHEIKLTYQGTSEFKKYTDYLDRQKIELLLPHKQEDPCEEAEYLSREIDPRQDQAPLVERDFNILKRKLISALNKESDIALISSKVLLVENLKSIEPEAFDGIREFLKENKKSVTAEFLVENFVKIDPKTEDFAAYCFALNYIMKTDYKIDFQQTNDVGWGKWNLISVIYYMKKNSIMSEENPLLNKVTFGAKKNISHKRRKFEESLFPDGISRYYLTQREITSGAVKVKPGFFDLGDSIEVEVIDSKTKKAYLIYYYSDVDLMLGFKEIFEKYKALQGTTLSFEQQDDGKLYFSIRTTKKGTIADKIEYDDERKAFRVPEEKIASPVFVFKAMFLESSILNSLYERIHEFRQVETFNKLVHKVFLAFGLKEKNYEIHVLRLHHILDIIFPVDLRLVEDVLLSNLEFVPAEKIAGVFYLDSGAVSEIEEEDYKRREMVVDESKKKRDEVRKKKRDEELQVKEEIRRKREDRRKKREEEMFLKEKLEKERREREEKRLQELKKKRETQKRAAVTPGDRIRARDGEDKPDFRKGDHRDFKKKDRDTPFKPKPETARPPKEARAEEFSGKAVHSKKVKKKKEEVKVPKTQKKAMKKPIEDNLSEEEIKSEIRLEKLKETIEEKKKGPDKIKKGDAEKKIAYKDRGGFGGVFASKLDEIVKQEEKGESEKQSSKK
jgi:hypothetical protein